MQKKMTTAACLAALFLAAGCSRTEAPAEPAAATVPAAPAPAPVAVAVPAPAPAPAPRAASLGGLDAHVWQVAASGTVAAGSLYVFLPEGTLLVATPGSPMAQGRWREEDGRLALVEEGRAYPADVLELQPQRLRLRSHNPGTPVDMTLVPVEAAAAPVPDAFQGSWASDAQACGQPGAETRLALAADRVRFHESGGPVLAAVPDPRDARRLDVVVRLQGEGSTRLAWRRFQLARDGATLADVTDGPHGGIVRVRCS